MQARPHDNFVGDLNAASPQPFVAASRAGVATGPAFSKSSKSDSSVSNGAIPRAPFRIRHPRGTMLILFVILVPIIFALGGLVLDLGLASYTRTTMQTAVDAGAMEGIRSRDDADLLTPASKRASVADIVAQHYDDDGDTSADAMDLGAGKDTPFFAANPGTSLANERRTIDGASIAPYKPALLANLLGAMPDMQEGDMLGGTYDYTQRHDEGYTLGAPYFRDDFASAGGATDFTAFLVRIRRSLRPEGTNSGYDSIPDVSSAGPTIPLLFGRLSAIKGADPNVEFSVRHSGLTARATSIAQALPAMVVGPTIPALAYGATPVSTIVGTAPFAVDVTFWNTLTVGIPAAGINWVIPPAGNSGELIQGVTVVGRTIGVWRSANALIAVDNVVTLQSNVGQPPFVNPKNNANWRLRMGREIMTVTSFIPATTFDYNVVRGVESTTAVAHAINIGAYRMDFVSVGDGVIAVDRPGGNNAPGVATRTDIINDIPTIVYVPLYANLGAPYGERIVGFGCATIVFDGAPANADVITLTKLSSLVAPRNASATPRYPITGFPAYSLNPVPWDAMFATGRNTIDQPLLAPASVRSYSR